MTYRNSTAEIHCLYFPQASLMDNYFFFSLQALKHLKGHLLCPWVWAFPLSCRRKQKWVISNNNWRNAKVGHQIQRATASVGRKELQDLMVLKWWKTESRISRDLRQRLASASPCGRLGQVSICTDPGHSRGQRAVWCLPGQALGWPLPSRGTCAEPAAPREQPLPAPPSSSHHPRPFLPTPLPARLRTWATAEGA